MKRLNLFLQRKVNLDDFLTFNYYIFILNNFYLAWNTQKSYLPEFALRVTDSVSDLVL